MIDKEIYRKNFRGGGADMGAGASGMGSGNSGGKSGRGNDARDRGMGMAGKTGDYSPGPTGGGGGGNQFTDLTKDVLNPNVDYVGNTVFGPTQKYTGANSFFGGANRYGYTNQYVDPTKPNFGQLKPGYAGRIFGGLAGLLTGIPFIGGAVGNLYDKGLGMFRNKFYDDMSQYNRLGLGGIDPTLMDNYSDMKISNTSFSPTNQPLFDVYKVQQMIEDSKSLPNDIDLQNRINISNQYELPLNYSSDDLRARAVRAMTQPGVQIELAPYEEGIPQELQFFDGRPYTETPYNPYTVDIQPNETYTIEELIMGGSQP